AQHDPVHQRLKIPHRLPTPDPSPIGLGLSQMIVVPAKRARLRRASAEPGPSISEAGVHDTRRAAPTGAKSAATDYWIPALALRAVSAFTRVFDALWPGSLGRNDSREFGTCAVVRGSAIGRNLT